MSRRGNGRDNAVAESFFSSLKKERIRKRIYKTRDRGRADIFDDIEVCSTTGPGATVTPAASVRRPSNGSRCKDMSTVVGQSNAIRPNENNRVFRLAYKWA